MHHKMYHGNYDRKPSNDHRKEINEGYFQLNEWVQTFWNGGVIDIEKTSKYNNEEIFYFNS